MNKKQLVAKISSTMNLSKADAERTFETIQISASQKVKFLPAKALKEMFNK